ncbi:MAG: HU family DNA-binding protein, partial [Gammaproteobacteria bacterium]|nr:HU family DNA-binding protein [Gammaproteobacteria bacterium]
MATAKKKTAKKSVSKTKTKSSATKKIAARSSKSKGAVSNSGLNLKDAPVTAKQTQAQIIADLAEATSLEKRAVRNLFEALKNQIQRHLKNRGSGEIVLPGLGIKVRR